MISHSKQTGNSGSWKSFDEVWKNYDYRKRRAGDITASFFEGLRIEELLNRFSGSKTIINIGCGSGKWSLPFIDSGFEVTNFDISEFALKISRERCGDENAANIRGDANSLPFKSDTFDIVMSFGLLEHFKEISRPIEEMVRVLKPGGIFTSDIITRRFSVQVIQKWINFCIYTIYAVFRLDVERLRNASWFIHGDYYENSYSQQEYLRAMRTAGLKHAQIIGKRCFPLLRIPSFAERAVVCLLGACAPLCSHFDRQASRFSNWWGAIWEASGSKPMGGRKIAQKPH